MNFIETTKKIVDIYTIMGIKLILTEDQLERLEKNIGTGELDEWGGANLKCNKMDYAVLDEYLGSKLERLLGYETRVVRDGHDIAIKHYRTNILKIDPTNIIKIDVRGWETKTTKDRLNQFLRCRDVYISQAKGKWTIHGTNDNFPYEDGAEVHQDGYVVLPSRNNRDRVTSKADIDPKDYELYGIRPEED